MKNLLIAATLSLPLLASAQNLITNGSFELGLTGWTTSQTPGTIYPVAPLVYNSLPGAFGEIVPTDNAALNTSPDAAGTRAVYFVDDNTTQVLSQTFTVTMAGLYNYGLSVYVPANGAANLGEATVSIQIGTAAPLVTTIGALPAATWLSASGFNFFTPGSYVAQLTFQTAGGASRDLVVDRVYVTSPVPEPGTTALLAAGLAAMGLVAARRRRG